MALQYQFRPLTTWPGPRTLAPRRCPFKATFGQTFILLERELSKLRAENVVIEADVDEASIRRDGMLYSNAKPRTRGIILSFNSRHGPLRYPCDTYERWEQNLRAIALALEALRAVDRYGVTRRAEQYTGWKALPAGIAGDHLDARVAAMWMAEELRTFYPDDEGIDPDLILDDRDTFVASFRDLAKKFHPDAGGKPGSFKMLTDARKSIEAHHNGLRA